MPRYHYTYRMDRTCSPDHERFGEYYIGVRSCDCKPEKDTRYRGSGVVLKKKQKGGVHYRKTILATFATREEALADEEERVGEDQLQDDLCLNLVSGGRGVIQSREFQQKHKEAVRKSWQDPERRRKQKEVARKRSQNPDYRRRHKDSMRKMMQDPEWQRKREESQRKSWQDPERRRKRIEAIRNSWQDPERRRKQKESIRKSWQDPERRRKHKESMRKSWQDPEWQRSHKKAVRKLSPLTEDDVREIRHRRTNGEKQVDLAKEFGVSQASISRIVLRKTWKDVD
jgi:hypothetical protein